LLHWNGVTARSVRQLSNTAAQPPPQESCHSAACLLSSSPKGVQSGCSTTGNLSQGRHISRQIGKGGRRRRESPDEQAFGGHPQPLGGGIGASGAAGRGRQGGGPP